MKNKQAVVLGIIFFIALAILLFIFNINSDYHFILTQLLLLQVIIGVIFYKQYVIYISIFFVALHIIQDAILLNAFPVHAFFESLIHLGTMFILLHVFKLRDILNSRLNNIVDATKIGIWEWHIKTKHIIINDYWAKMLGYTLAELNPISIKTWEDLTHPNDLQKSYEVLNKVMNKELDFYDVEIRMRHKSGKYIWINDRGMVTSWSINGKADIMSGTHTDVTENREGKDKIFYFHNLMSYVIDHMNSGIAVHDKNLNYVFVSKKYLEQYNITGNIIGKHHYDVFPDLPQKWRDVHQRCLKGESLKADRDPYVRDDGRVEMTRWECRPWYDESNEIAGIVVYTEVITDFIKIENELRTSKEMLQTVMDNLPIGIAVNSVLPNVQFDYLNDKFAEAYNTTRDALEKADFWDVVYEDDTFRKKIKTKVLADIASQDKNKMMWKDVPITKNGEIVKYVTAFASQLPGKSSLISTVIDSTLRKQLELSLESSLRESFIQKEKIEATLLAIGDAVISTDENGLIIAFNEIASEITGYSKMETAGKSFTNFFHIVDEITKKDLPCPVKRVIDSGEIVHLENHTLLITKNNDYRMIEDSAAPIRNQNGDLIGVILVFRDVTEKRLKQQQIEYLSLHDYLTGVYNRRFFTEKMVAIDKAEHYPLGVMMIDVNGLKIVNDAFGHDIGDSVLKEVANSITQVIGDRGIVSRIGGDEFTVMLENTSLDELQVIKDAVSNEVSKHTIQNITLSVSTGYALKSDVSEDISELLKNAENYMYKFKLAAGQSARNHTIQAILKTLTDKYTLERTHSERVGRYSKLLGEALNMNKDEVKELELSGLFHDIGKITIPDSILNKPSRLTPEEFAIIKEHPRNGYMILRAADEYSDLAQNALLHHEYYDGSGYPEGLKGETIPLQARIICIADAYEAMTSDRPYRAALKQEKAIEELLKFKAKQFDPVLVDIFIAKVLPQQS